MEERSVYRIIDANFNRAREAVRVIEEFCRFALNSALFTERAKQIRHQLCSTIDQLGAGRLLSSRDTPGDVGAGRRVDEQLQRGNLRDCLTAACKRLTEALRALSETTQMLNPSVAEAIENLRYTAYTLEKDITLFSDTTEKFRKVRLYVIINSPFPADVIPLTYRCIVGEADCIQLRVKGATDNRYFALAAEFVKICRDGGVLSIINDRVDIAAASGADGVHLGPDDLHIEQAKKLQLAPLIIGKSTHSVEQLEFACRQLPAYVSLGPVFKTGTKPALEPVGINYVKQATEMLADTGICSVAIGGITPENIEAVLGAGAKTVAVCSAVTEAQDPIAACRLLKEKITGFNK